MKSLLLWRPQLEKAHKKVSWWKELLTEKSVMKSDTFFEYMTQLLCMMTVIAGCRPTQHTLVLYWSKGTPWPPLTLAIHEDTNVWDTTECEIFFPGYLSDLMVFWQHSYICMIVGEIAYRSFFSYHLSHNESNFLVALDVTHVLLNKITKSLLRSYCVVFNSTWENSWIRIVLSKMGQNKMYVVILYFLRKRLQAEPPTPLQTGL